MEVKGISRAYFQSAHKVGARFIHNIHNEDGTINKEKLLRNVATNLFDNGIKPSYDSWQFKKAIEYVVDNEKTIQSTIENIYNGWASVLSILPPDVINFLSTTYFKNQSMFDNAIFAWKKANTEEVEALLVLDKIVKSYNDVVTNWVKDMNLIGEVSYFDEIDNWLLNIVTNNWGYTKSIDDLWYFIAKNITNWLKLPNNSFLPFDNKGVIAEFNGIVDTYIDNVTKETSETNKRNLLNKVRSDLVICKFIWFNREIFSTT